MSENFDEDLKLRSLLLNCVTLIDQLLPGVGNCVVDVGLLNDTLIKVRPEIQDVCPHVKTENRVCSTCHQAVSEAA